MNNKKYQQIRVIVTFFVAAIVSVSVIQENVLMAALAVVTGMLFLLAVKSKTNIVVDEREKAIREKAAHLTYAIFAPTLGIGSFLLIVLGQKTPYLFALGQVLAYLSLFMIAIYAISFHYLNRKLSGIDDEK